MHDDQTLANHLGAAPAQPDPRFRVAVIARIGERARRRAHWRRAVQIGGAFALAGLVVPLARVSGVDAAELSPALTLAAALGLVYLGAIASISGPRALLAHAGGLLRIRL